jgi:hypothetical protein
MCYGWKVAAVEARALADTYMCNTTWNLRIEVSCEGVVEASSGRSLRIFVVLVVPDVFNTST